MKLLVTGGAGFIGSHVAHFLVEEGHQVRVFDNLSEGNLKNLSSIVSNIEFIEGDLRDEEAVSKAVKDVDGIYHLAALASVPWSISEPMLFQEVNATGTLRLYQEAAKAGVRRVVFSSTSAVYGDSETEQNVETLPSRPRSPYAATKLDGEFYGQVYTRAMGLEVVSLRYFNVYGPRQSVTSPYAAVIPIFGNKALNGEALTIYGDGEQTRDFVYVEDVVKANILAMQVEGAEGEAFNVSGDNRISLNHLVDSIREQLPDLDIKAENAPIRIGDIKHSRADISKAKQVLGFNPQINLEEGLSLTIQHIKKEVENDK